MRQLQNMMFQALLNEVIDSQYLSHITLIWWTSESKYLSQAIQSPSFEPQLGSCASWTPKYKSDGAASVDTLFAII